MDVEPQSRRYACFTKDGNKQTKFSASEFVGDSTEQTHASNVFPDLGSKSRSKASANGVDRDLARDLPTTFKDEKHPALKRPEERLQSEEQ